MFYPSLENQWRLCSQKTVTNRNLLLSFLLLEQFSSAWERIPSPQPFFLTQDDSDESKFHQLLWNGAKIPPDYVKTSSYFAYKCNLQSSILYYYVMDFLMVFVIMTSTDFNKMFAIVCAHMVTAKISNHLYTVLIDRADSP